jgi:hypothetical protein
MSTLQPQNQQTTPKLYKNLCLYATFSFSSNVLSMLTNILGIEVDLSELERQAEDMEQKIEKIREPRTSQEDRTKEADT